MRSGSVQVQLAGHLYVGLFEPLILYLEVITFLILLKGLALSLYFDAGYVNNPRLVLEDDGRKKHTRQPFNYTEVFSSPARKCRAFKLTLAVSSIDLTISWSYWLINNGCRARRSSTKTSRGRHNFDSRPSCGRADVRKRQMELASWQDPTTF